MHTFINSRAMAQMVAFDLMHEEQRRAAVRRERRDRRRAARSTPEEEGSPEPRRYPWHLAKALHLMH
jgi:hypothetical protein